MKKNKYLILYYISFVITIAFSVFSTYKYHALYGIGEEINTGLITNILENIFVVINLILVIAFTILIIKKKKIVVDSLMLPISYICFFIIVMILCFLFNNKVMVPYIHFEYYLFFINTGLLFLNSYSLFLINYKK